MKVINVFKAQYDRQREDGRTSTISIDTFFLTTNATLRSARNENNDSAGFHGSETVSGGLALQLDNGKTYPVKSLGKVLNSSGPKKRPCAGVFVSKTRKGAELVTVSAKEESIAIWNGKGRLPRRDRVLVQIEGYLYELESTYPVKLAA